MAVNQPSATLMSLWVCELLTPFPMFLGIPKIFLLWSSQLCETTSENKEKVTVLKKKILTLSHNNSYWYVNIDNVWYC